jgi:hypothetical protein
MNCTPGVARRKGDTKMLIETKKVETTVETEIALDECGGHVMLSLRYGGDKFCQALTARDMGKILAICDQYKEQVVCCDGDLIVNYVISDHQVVEFVWHAEGHVCKVVLETTDMFAFEWACRSYCRQLFRTNKGV